MTALPKELTEITANVVIAVPCQDTVAAGFMYDLAMLVGFTTKYCPNIAIHMTMVRGTIIPAQRHLLVTGALKHEGATHILWLDADMRFPKETLLKLLALNLPIVCANYPTRRQPIIPTAENSSEGLLFTGEDDVELIEAERVGMGVMLTQLDIFRALPTPWFAVGFNKASGEYVGEDVFFCQLARKAGYQVFVDPRLSNEIQHLGEFAYKMVHAKVTLESAQTQLPTILPPTDVERRELNLVP
jgi:hypothetical protein